MATKLLTEPIKYVIMKRTWIFFAFAVFAFVFAPSANATTNLNSEITEFQSQSKLPGGVYQILCECSKLVPFTYEELVEMYWQKTVLIEKIDTDTIRVTILQADGNPVIADIIDNF